MIACSAQNSRLKVSLKKLLPIARMIKGLSYNEALAQLTFSEKVQSFSSSWYEREDSQRCMVLHKSPSRVSVKRDCRMVLKNY
jgi:ribosomal protein L22